jgi:predicted ATPase
MQLNNNLYILTGGPGAGKTTTLLELERLGIPYIPEVARQIIQEQVRDSGTALPWADRERYISIMLQRSIDSYLQHAQVARTTFADRGIPDTLAYATRIWLGDHGTMREACNELRCAKKVFIAPPWEEIYETDSERKQDFREAVQTYAGLVRTYEECKYELIELPRGTPRSRAEFILDKLGLSQRG